MEKVNIFGGTGFVGSNYAKLYPNDVEIIPRESNSSLGENRDALYLISTVHNYHVFSDLHQDINTNLKKLMDVLPNVKGTFNFVSSWFVYGDGFTQENPAKENSHCDPRGFYSITKKAAEDLLISYSKTFDKNYRILRLSNIIGGDPKSEKRKNALEYLIRQIINNEPINIYNGDNYRNFLHVEDACDAIKIVIEDGNLNEIYNIGANESTKIIDIVNYVIKKVGSKSTITYIDSPKFHKIVQTENFFMDCKKLRTLKFRPKYTLFQSVDTIIEKIKS